MCQDEECPVRKDCYRYMAIPDEYLQPYFSESPRGSNGCTCFFEIRNKRVRDDDDSEGVL